MHSSFVSLTILNPTSHVRDHFLCPMSVLPGLLEPDLLSLLQVNAGPCNISASPPLDYSARITSLLVTPWCVRMCAAASAATGELGGQCCFAADHRALELYALAGLCRAARMQCFACATLFRISCLILRRHLRVTLHNSKSILLVQFAKSLPA